VSGWQRDPAAGRSPGGAWLPWSSSASRPSGGSGLPGRVPGHAPAEA
jgi:hypothetical protein